MDRAAEQVLFRTALTVGAVATAAVAGTPAAVVLVGTVIAKMMKDAFTKEKVLQEVENAARKK